MKKSKILYFFKFTLAYLAGSFILAAIISLMLDRFNSFTDIQFFFTVIFFTAYLSGLLGKLFFFYFSTKSQKEIIRKIIPAFLIFWIGALFIATLVINISLYLWNRSPTSTFFIQANDFLYSFKALAPWIFVSAIIFFYVLWRKGVLREQKLTEEILNFKYQTLKNQVNPHFLFNSLNTLSSLINSNPKQADDFTNKLSDIYRYILLNENKTLVSLKEEIQFVNDYFDLQKIRDEGKIFLEINIENPESFLIVPISLQALVENALKHNSATQKNPLKTRIDLKSMSIIVANNLQRKTSIENSAKTGLKNLGERIKLITHKSIVVFENQNEFSVEVPILKKK